MIVDSSVIIAILRDEPDSGPFIEALRNAPRKLIAAPSYLECCIVATKDRNADAMSDIDNLLGKLDVRIVGFSPDMAKMATAAYLAFGKGRGHPAQLNFGDCMSYAVSKVEAMPLLFKGGDFRLTDVDCAIEEPFAPELR